MFYWRGSIIIMAGWQLLTWLDTSERETQMVCNLMPPHKLIYKK